MVLLNLLLAALFSLMRWSPDGDGAAGGTTTDAQSGTKDKDKPAGDSSPGTQERGTSGKTFTQEELNAIVKDRLDREKGKYSDYDEVKAKAERLDQLEASQKSDLDKANEKAERAERERDEALAKANARLIIAEIKAQASGKRVRAEAIDMLVATLAQNEAIKVEDDGTVSGVDKALDEYLKGKDFLLAKETPGQSGAEFNGKDQATIDEQIADAESKGDWRLSNRLKLQKARSQQ